MDIPFADVADLKAAYEGSYYFIAGTGGDLSTWVSGYEDLLNEAEIGKPVKWLQTNGATVNMYAVETYHSRIERHDQFPGDLTCLLFPLDGLHPGRLAILKVQLEDRWFDDVIQNMRT